MKKKGRDRRGKDRLRRHSDVTGKGKTKSKQNFEKTVF